MSLRRDLATFEPRGAAEVEAQRRMEALLGQASARAFRRDHLLPGHFTASGFVVSPDGGSLLLIFHRKLQRWLQPGGHFELDDADHLAAARREVAEEVGLSDLELVAPLYDLDVHTIPANAKEAEHLHFDLRVLFRSKTMQVAASSEVMAARYFSLQELTSGGASSVGSDESVARVARRLLDGP